MAILHLVNRAAGLASCLAVAAPEDEVLLIADAVAEAFRNISRPVYALEEDLVARDLTDDVPGSVTLTDYPGFVDLVATCHPIVSWR